jgi:hypothetical protein
MPLTAQESLKNRVNRCVSIARVMDIIRWCCLSMVGSTITQAVDPGYQRFEPDLVKRPLSSAMFAEIEGGPRFS